jgi:hypothetical protein
MTTLELSHDVQNGIYDPDDVGLRDSPLLKPHNPKLQPTPSPPPEDLESEYARPVPSQGDAVLIGLLGGGKALEVARRAGTENLATDDEVNTTHGRSDDLEYPAADALNDFHAAAPNGQTGSLLVRATIAGRPNKLPPIQEPSTKSEKASNLKLPSISAQADHLLLLADTTAANKIGDKDPNSTYQSPTTQSSLVTPDSQIRSTPSTRTRTPRPTLPNNNFPTSPRIGGFKCTYAGCTAKPFHTQYLLKSHANVHSSDRRYYCPVKGCSRGEGGKGFKRKNEMIRHGLVHESPGYACPYCVDQGRRYPRPDNLQRLVFRYMILELM